MQPSFIQRRFQILLIAFLMLSLAACAEADEQVMPSPTAVLMPTTTPIPLPIFTPTKTPLSSTVLTATPVTNLTPVFFDASTPVPPASEWDTFIYADSGLIFQYPLNWFLSLSEENNRVEVMNAPACGSICMKSGSSGEFIKIAISLTPRDTEAAPSLLAYIQNNLSDTLPPENIISIEERANSSQGYSVVQAIYTGLGVSNVLYLANGDSFVSVKISYGEGNEVIAYLPIMEKIADTLVFSP